MRILIDLQSCQNGSRLRGIGRYALAITKAMLRLDTGHEFWIALSDRFPGSIEEIRADFAGLLQAGRIVVFHLPAGVSGGDAANAWRSRAAEALREQALAALNPDVLFLPSLFEGFHDECVTSIGQFPIPTAVTVHDLIPLVRPEQYIIGLEERACYNRKLLSLKRADLWLAVSEFAKGEACELLALPPQRVINTLEAVEDQFRPIRHTTAERREILNRFGIARPFVMFTSAIEHRKNVDGLIRAFGRLPATVRQRHQLVLVGSADAHTRRRLAQVVEEAGLREGEMLITGRVSDADLINLYNLCALFAFPSFHEGFGLPLLEAMACGAAVIGSNVSSIPEVIGRADALFDPQDIDDMARLMARVLTDDAFRGDLCKYGPVRAASFTWEAAALRAVQGFEALHDQRAAQVEGARAAPAGERPSLAYVCPLPPQSGPAARRALGLVSELARRYEICLITDQDAVDVGRLTANFPVCSPDWLRAEARRFRRIVYDLEGASDALKDLVPDHPGVVLLGDFATAPVVDADDTEGLAWLCDIQGYEAVLAARSGERGLTAETTQLMAMAEVATGMVALSEHVRHAAIAGLGPDAEAWVRFAPLRAGLAAAGDRIAEAIEYFTHDSPAARRLRTLAAVSAPLRTPASTQDRTAVVQAIAANVRPLGHSRLFIEVDAFGGLTPDARAAATALIADLARDPAFGWRVEPVYRLGGVYRHGRSFMSHALGLHGLGLEDDPANAYPGDRLLIMGLPPSEIEPAHKRFMERGVRVLFLAEPALDSFSQASPAVLRPVLKAWLDQIGDLEAGALWTPDATGHALAAPAKSTGGSGALDALRALWRSGIEGDLLLVQPQGALSDAAAQACALGEIEPKRLRRLDLERGDLAQDLRALAAYGASQADPAGDDLNYTVMGHTLGHYSLALINRAVARAIEKIRPGRVLLAPYENGPVTVLDGVPEAERAEMVRLAARAPSHSGRSVAISQHYPLLPPEGDWDLSLALFAWEETSVPPATVRALSNGFDAVLATSAFTARALVDSGLKAPVASIGQPPQIAPFLNLKRAEPQRDDPFVFLHVSSGFPRKGVDVLLAAWAKAFTAQDRVRLVLKTFPNPHNDLARQLDAFHRLHPDAAPIEWIDEDIEQSALLDLYRAADTVVSPSRGEGYNLSALEAMAAGVPLIVTGYGGHRDFCGPNEARLVKFVLAASRSHVAGPSAVWAEPDQDDLASALREMVDPQYRELIKARVLKARSAAMTAASPGLWVSRLDRLAQGLMNRPARRTPKIAWISTWGVHCGIAEYSRLLLARFTGPVRAGMVVFCATSAPRPARWAACRRSPPGPSAPPVRTHPWRTGSPRFSPTP